MKNELRISTIQNRLIDTLILISAFSAFPAVGFSLYRITDTGWQPLMFIHISCLLFNCIAALIRKRLPLWIKTAYVVSVLFLLGAGGLMTTGLSGFGLEFFQLSIIIATVFMGFRFGILIGILDSLLLLAVGLTVVNGGIRYQVDLGEYAYHLSSWLSACAGFVCVNIVVIGVIGYLYQILVDQIEELNQKTQTISEQNEEQRELLHILCHDLANPLSNIQTSLRLYLKRTTLNKEKLLEYIQVSIRNGLEIVKLVQEMNAVDEQKKELKIEALNLAELIEEATEILSGRIEEKNILLRVHIDEKEQVMVEKTSFINSILNNIFSNAIKFSFSGSQIHVNTWKDDDYTVLSIKDQGIGMPEKLLCNIFNPNKPTNRKGTEGEKGTGFGMPLVKKFITAYGGSIEVHSEEKKEGAATHGTDVRLKLKSA